MTGPQMNPTNAYREISPESAAKIKRATLLPGLGTLLASVVLALAMVAGARGLGILYNPISRLMVAVEMCGMFFLLITGIIMVMSRRVISGAFFNTRDAVVLRRWLVVFCAGIFATSLMAFLFLSVVIGASKGFSGEPVLHWTAAMWSYLLLPAVGCVISLVDAMIGRRALHVSQR